MRKSKKGRAQEPIDCLPLFDNHSSAKEEGTVPPRGTDNIRTAEVICFHTAVEMRKTAVQTSLEKAALNSILARAKKLTW